MTDPQPYPARMSVLAVEVRPHTNPDWPQVRLLVDGTDIFEAAAPGWLGFDPDIVINGNRSPLLPCAEAERVAVQRCSCGEAGCGVIAPLIELSPDGRCVRWSDFRDYTGVFFGPSTRHPQLDLVPSRQWGIPDLRFDREQYVAAITRAAEDRSWETPDRTTARLLYEQLEPLCPDSPRGLPLQAVYPGWDGDGIIARFGVESEDDTLDVEELRLISLRKEPAEAASEMAAQLLAIPPDEWLRTFAVR